MSTAEEVMQEVETKAITLYKEGSDTNLSEPKGLDLGPQEMRQLAYDIHGASVRTRVADKWSPRTKLLIPGTVNPWECLPTNRFRKRASLATNNPTAKAGTLLLGSLSVLSNLENTSTNVPYVAISGPVVALTLGADTTSQTWDYFGANAVYARYFGPATAKVWVSVSDYSWMTGTPV